MEKTGEIRPGSTPDTEERLATTKTGATASTASQIRELDDDVTRRLADASEKQQRSSPVTRAKIND